MKGNVYNKNSTQSVRNSEVLASVFVTINTYKTICTI